jgi:DNA primase
MARLTEQEKQDIVRYLKADKPLPDKGLVCEGESDTWTALSYGFAAVGSPGAKGFKSSWVEGFRGLQDADGRSTVYLVLDADKAGAEGSLTIADLFLKAGLPVPLKLAIPSGKDLTDFMKGGKTE